MTTNACVRLLSVRKNFRNKEVLKGLDLEIPEGSVFGLIGPNGAGKTTTLKILLNLYRAVEGYVEVFGRDVAANEAEIKQRIGFVSETRALPEYMTGAQLLKALRPLYDRWNEERIQKYVTRLKIPLDRKIGTLSLGERTRVALVAAVAHDPDLLILDEPTNGLDALARETFFRLISEEYADANQSVLIASNVIPEVERVCDSLAVIADGRVIVSGGVEELKENVKMVQFPCPEDRNWMEHPEVLVADREGDIVSLVTRKPMDGLLKDLKNLHPSYVHIVDLNLTEIFVRLVSRWV
jgi:ABC-2 type transport system ATP-binding protein